MNETNVKLFELLDCIANNYIIEDSDYYYNDNKVPRVTKIIQRCIHSNGLMHWANYLGFKHKSYNKELTIAATIGTQCHNSIDKYLNDNSYEPENIMQEARNAYNSYLKWLNEVKKYANVEIIYREKTLICKYFGGTLDGLYKFNDKIYIVDYKTSNHINFNYCLQLAAYIIMLEIVVNIKVDGCIILQLSKHDTGYNEFTLNFDKPEEKEYMEQCKTSFLSMALWYYNLIATENGFKLLNWR